MTKPLDVGSAAAKNTKKMNAQDEVGWQKAW
jgi:hypothetical protein